MSNKQQTAVDIIYQGISNKIVMQDLNKALICIHISHDDFLKLHRQAKAMHKEETLKLYYAYEDYVLREEGIIKTFGQFYNETFGGNNEQQ